MRVLCRFAVPAVTAIFLCVYLLPDWLLLPLGTLFLVLGLLSLAPGDRTRRMKITLTALGLAFGLLWTGLWGLLFRAPALDLDQHAQLYTVTLDDYPAPSRWGIRVPVRIHVPGVPDPRAMLYGRTEELEGLKPGDVLRGQMTPKAIHRQLRRRTDYNQSRGIFLTLSGTGLETVEQPEQVPLQYLHRQFAHALKQSITEAFPRDVSGFAAALVTGDKAMLPPGLYAAFQRSGLAHVVAVSGLHVSFLIAALTLLFGRGRRATAALGMALALFFALSVGSTPSVMRAVFMSGLLLLAPLVGREPDGPTTLSAILLLLLLGCPWAAASAGLHLSFAAVAGIYLITPALVERGSRRLPRGKLLHGLLFAVLTSLSTTLGALLFTTPLAAVYFGTFSLTGLVTNLLTLWAVSLTFLGALAAGLAGLVFPSAGAVLAAAAAWPARLVTGTAVGIGAMPLSSLDLSSPYLLAWFVAGYALALAILCRRGRGFRPWIPLTACGLCLCAALTLELWPVRTAALALSVLDPEDGCAAVLSSDGHAVAVDCGSQGGPDPGDLSADRLLALGCRELDALVVTSCSRSHSDGVPQLLARIPTRELLLPMHHEGCARCAALRDAAEALGCRARHLTGDETFSFGRARLTVWEPMGWDAGQAVRCTAEDFSVLFTGGLGREREDMLARYKDLPRGGVLVTAADHIPGSALLLEAHPASAVLTGGQPHPRVLEQLGAAGCLVWPTAETGIITFTIPRK